MKAATYKASEPTLDESLTSSDGSWLLKRAQNYKARSDNYGKFIRTCIMVLFAARASG
jgi:hypothetical protein